MIKLTNEDNMALMARYPDGYFELAIVDPPYGINAPNQSMGSNPNRKDMKGGISVAEKIKKGRLNQGSGKLKNRLLNKSNINWDDSIPNQEYFNELKRISKNQIIWGGNYFPLPPTRCILAWNKLQPWDNFSQFEMAWTSFDKPAGLFTHSNTGGANSEIKIHPTQKPVALYKWILSKYAKQGDKILDTHLGSMSIAIACHDLGFDLVGCELDTEYYQKGLERVNNHIKQGNLFIPQQAIITTP